MTAPCSRDILDRAELRKTRPRLAVLDVLLRADDPLTHEQLSARLRRRRIDRVTLYRTLETFIEADIVHRVSADDRVWRFAVCGHGHRRHCHPHFTCRRCGSVECLTGLELPRVARVPDGYTVESQELYLRGVCAQCAADQHRR
jgi:Fur family ferric uptake transcriptional regulator